MAIRQQCCVCLRVLEHEGPGEVARWRHVGRVLSQATHAYCPDCIHELRAQIDTVVEARRRARVAHLGA